MHLGSLSEFTGKFKSDAPTVDVISVFPAMTSQYVVLYFHKTKVNTINLNLEYHCYYYCSFNSYLIFIFIFFLFFIIGFLFLNSDEIKLFYVRTLLKQTGHPRPRD